MPPLRPKNIEPRPSQVFGIPRGVAGRAGYEIQGIVLHCLGQSLESYANTICEQWKTTKAKPDHASVHYGVGYDGNLMQFVEDADISWGFSQYLSNFVTTGTPPALNWPTLTAANPDTTPDYYVLNIGLESGFVRGLLGEDCHCGPDQPTDLGRAGYERLVALVAWLAETYDIPITAEYITFHQRIDPNAEDECVCADLEQFLSDVDNYCQPCENPAPPLPYGEIIDVIGRAAAECEDEVGCEVYQPLSEIIPAETPFLPNDSDSIEWAAGGPYGHEPTAHVRVSGDPCNAVTINADGLYVEDENLTIQPEPGLTVEEVVQDCNRTVLLGIEVSDDPCNGILVRPDGVYSPRITFVGGDTPTVEVDVSDAVDCVRAITANVKVSGDGCNAAEIRPDGVYVEDQSLSVVPTGSIEHELIPNPNDPNCGYQLSSRVIYSEDEGNAAGSGSDGGVYVPATVSPIFQQDQDYGADTATGFFDNESTPTTVATTSLSITTTRPNALLTVHWVWRGFEIELLEAGNALDVTFEANTKNPTTLDPTYYVIESRTHEADDALNGTAITTPDIVANHTILLTVAGTYNLQSRVTYHLRQTKSVVNYATSGTIRPVEVVATIIEP